VSDQHDKFKSRLEGSRHAMFVVAEWLHKKGRSVGVMIRKFVVSPTAAEAIYYVDEGDVLLTYRYEVKRLININFTCRKDFPYDNVMFASVASAQRAGEEVIGWYVVSGDYRTVAVVNRALTREFWEVWEGRAPNTGNLERNYVCPKEHVQFEIMGVVDADRTADAQV
jgi:hypothetical protein